MNLRARQRALIFLNKAARLPIVPSADRLIGGNRRVGIAYPQPQDFSLCGTGW